MLLNLLLSMLDAGGPALIWIFVGGALLLIVFVLVVVAAVVVLIVVIVRNNKKKVALAAQTASPVQTPSPTQPISRQQGGNPKP